MQARKTRFPTNISLAVSGLICALPLWGCDPDQRAALIEQVSDSVSEQLDAEKEALLEEIKAELGDAMADAGDDVEEAVAETLGQNENALAADDASQDDENGEHESPPPGVLGLNTIDVLHPELGGIFGPVEVEAQEARIHGEHEATSTRLEIWTDDYRQMVLLEISGGLTHDFFQSEGEHVFHALPEGASPQAEVHVAGASCFGSVPYELEEDIRAHEVTLRKSVDEDSGAVVLEFELVGWNEATEENEIVHASVELHSVD